MKRHRTAVRETYCLVSSVVYHVLSPDRAFIMFPGIHPTQFSGLVPVGVLKDCDLASHSHTIVNCILDLSFGNLTSTKLEG